MAPPVSRTDTAGVKRAEALLRVPGCENGSAPISIAQLFGGTTNAMFRVRTRRGVFVMRINEPDTTLLGIDRARELSLHAAAARAAIAPTLVYADPQMRFLITEYVEGHMWTAEDMADAGSLRRLATTLRRLHELSAPAVSAFDPSGLLRRHASRIALDEPEDAARIEAWVLRAQQIFADTGGRSPCIVHNDLHHSNLIGSGPKLIDWEYAAVADPLLDLACLLAWYPASAAHTVLLLEECGLAPHSTPTALADAAWAFLLLSYLWYRSRRLAGMLDGAGTERHLFERLAATG